MTYMTCMNARVLFISNLSCIQREKSRFIHLSALYISQDATINATNNVIRPNLCYYHSVFAILNTQLGLLNVQGASLRLWTVCHHLSQSGLF